jgi:apoptosis-inducing factor 2
MAENKQKNIVILGGSYGGVSVAHYLLKHAVPHLPNKNSYRVVLVSISSQVMSRPATPRNMISDDYLDQKKMFVNIPDVFQQYPQVNFRYIKGQATSLDTIKREVTVAMKENKSKEVLNYYALVIATGASTPSPLLSFNKDDEVYLKERWLDFRAKLPSVRSIIIAGGGPAGIEMAGELGEHLNGRAGWFASKLDQPKVPITVITSGERIIPVLRPSLGKAAEDLLAKVGVTVRKNTRIIKVVPENSGAADAVVTKTTVTTSDGETLETDLYIPAVGTTPNTDFVTDKSLLAEDGRIETNVKTLRVDKAGPRVFAIGDASTFARAAIHNIFSGVPILSANLKSDLLVDAGKDVGPDKEHKGDVSETQLVPIGKSKGVGALGGYQLPGLLVWAIKGRDYWLWTTGPLWSGKNWTKEAK